LVAWLK